MFEGLYRADQGPIKASLVMGQKPAFVFTVKLRCMLGMVACSPKKLDYMWSVTIFYIIFSNSDIMSYTGNVIT